MVDPRNLWVQAASLYLFKWEISAFSWALGLIINIRGCSAVVKLLSIFFMVLSLPQTQGQHRAGCCLPRGFGATSCFPLFQLLPPVLRIKLNISRNQETNFMRAGFEPNLGDIMEYDGKICSLCKVLGHRG